jgi:hypothetical protein
MLTLAQRTYTGMNMYNEDIFVEINLFLDKIEAAKLEHLDHMPANVECVLSLDEHRDNKGAYECYYYLVDHVNRTLFWMNEFFPDDLMLDVASVTVMAHLRE